MIGMAIAIGVTLLLIASSMRLTFAIIVGAIAVGGGVGAVIARQIKMTAMPQLVAAFHSLVGLAAVAGRRRRLPRAASFRHRLPLAHSRPARLTAIVIELSVGFAIGAVTFTGSVIAFAKLNGNMSGAPIILPARHVHQYRHRSGYRRGHRHDGRGQRHDRWAFWAITGLSLLFGITLIIPIGGADMPVVVSMLNSYSGWAAAAHWLHAGKHRADHHRRAGRLIGRHPLLHHVQGHEPQFHFRHSRAASAAKARSPAGKETRPVKQGSAEDAAFIMKNAGKVIIVPGYGMAVAQAQHACAKWPTC